MGACAPVTQFRWFIVIKIRKRWVLASQPLASCTSGRMREPIFQSVQFQLSPADLEHSTQWLKCQATDLVLVFQVAQINGSITQIGFVGFGFEIRLEDCEDDCSRQPNVNCRFKNICDRFHYSQRQAFDCSRIASSEWMLLKNLPMGLANTVAVWTINLPFIAALKAGKYH